MATISTDSGGYRVLPGRRIHASALLLLVGACLMICDNPVFAQALVETGILRNVEIDRQEIFPSLRLDSQSGDQPGKPRLRIIPSLINRLHWLTRDSVVRRQVWLKPGDTVTRADVDEIERNLRRLDLFSEVEATTRRVADKSSEVDLVITTRDRLSLVFSGGGSFLGGVGQVQFSVGERNLFGLGHRLTFGYAENTEGELRGTIAYDNVLLFGNDVFGAIRAGRTEEGSFSSVNVTNRFLNLQDRKFWAVDASNNETRLDYYEEGESVAEVPRVINKLEVRGQRRAGDRHRLWRYGLSTAYRDIQYDEATGPGAADISVPDDTEKVYLGGVLGYDTFREYQKVTWLDTLMFQQDLSLGYGIEFQGGIEFSRTDEDSRNLPLVAFDAWSAQEVAQGNYLSASLETLAGFEGSDMSVWSLGLAGRWFNTRLPRQTIAVSLSINSAYSDDSGLPPEQSLGENNGLRGYPAREFNGEQKVLLNIEDRIRTPLSIASFRIGVVGFFDTGWVTDRGANLEDPHSSAGFGLRIGSRPILGSGVVRMDVAFPLDDNPDRDYQPTFSLALGQVFDFNP